MVRKKQTIVTYLGFMLFMILFLLPLYILITVSLKSNQDVFSFPIHWWPEELIFQNWVDIWGIIPLLKLYQNTYYVIFFSILLTLIITIPAAYAFSALNFYAKKTIIVLTLMSQMFVQILVIVPLFNLMKSWGLIDNLLSLIISDAAFNTAFLTFLLKGFFDTIPNELQEAALLDGCTKLQSLFLIYVPLSRSGIVVGVIYSAIMINNEFIFSNTFITSNEKNVLSVALFKLIQANPYEDITWNYVMAAALFASLPVYILFILIRKNLTRGITAGAIK